MKTIRCRSGFSLVELLTVIAVIGILVAIIIPTVGKVQDNARKTTARSNLRQIAIAYQTYATEGGRPKTINASSAHDWARVLAENAGLNEPDIYILKDDPVVEQSARALPRVIATPPESGTGKWTLEPSFDGFPLSFTVANKVSSRAPASTTPIAWTRGLSLAGTWNDEGAANPGVYGTEGGHIAFLDGHVDYYDDLAKDGGQLIDYKTKKPTASVQAALNPGAEGLNYNGKSF